MRAITAEIRRRVEARGPGIGVWQGDITTLDVDAIVNAANQTLAGGGGVDGAIHRAAGPDLKAACLALPEVRPAVRCPTGGARITDGFQLPARHVIHAVGPVWHGGEENERELLAAAYHNSLDLALQHSLATVAFPALSTGAFAYPPFDAAAVAVETVAAFQRERAQPERVVLVAFDAEAEKALRRVLRRAR
ncbi:MAG: O-acetyl-ADP-ribose deacetylase [Bacteroidota bacterium]